MNKRLYFWLAGLAAALLVIGNALGAGMNHDEHQFIAPAVLLLEGKLPYRDYPLFHVPSLAFVYAGLIKLTGAPLFSARLFNGVCSLLLVFLVFAVVRRARPGQPHLQWLAAAAALLLVCDPLFIEGGTRSWNQSTPALLALLAFYAVTRAAREETQTLPVLVSGLCIGVASAMRVSYLPLLAPFGIAPLLLHWLSWRRRFALCAVFSVGALIGMAPALTLLFSAPEQFRFGVFEFPRIGLLDPANDRIRKTMVWWRKLRFFAKEIVVPSLPLYAPALLLGVAGGIRRARTTTAGQAAQFIARMLLLIIPFLLMGAFAPSRYQYQHFFNLVPFVAVLAGYGLAEAFERFKPERAVWYAIGVLSAIAVIRALPLQKDSRPSQWTSNRIRTVAQEITRYVKVGPVLTLAPVYPIEAGLKIYPEFATGPFAWRSARLLDPARRRACKLVAPQDLEELLEQRPPAAILVGYEEKFEKPLIDYAKAHRFSHYDLPGKAELWVAPPRE